MRKATGKFHFWQLTQLSDIRGKLGLRDEDKEGSWSKHSMDTAKTIFQDKGKGLARGSYPKGTGTKETEQDPLFLFSRSCFTSFNKPTKPQRNRTRGRGCYQHRIQSLIAIGLSSFSLQLFRWNPLDGIPQSWRQVLTHYCIFNTRWIAFSSLNALAPLIYNYSHFTLLIFFLWLQRGR